jgi:hypothetical protein
MSLGLSYLWQRPLHSSQGMPASYVSVPIIRFRVTSSTHCESYLIIISQLIQLVYGNLVCQINLNSLKTVYVFHQKYGTDKKMKTASEMCE